VADDRFHRYRLVEAAMNVPFELLLSPAASIRPSSTAPRRSHVDHSTEV
jgi:hypothetical protein